MHPFLERLHRGKKTLFVLALLFVLAFAIRAHLLKFELFFEFDSYYHARMVGEIIRNGVLPARDPLAYYQLGGATLPAVGSFFWEFNALIYKIFTLNGAYDKDTLIALVKLMPAVYGAITAALMFFLGRELYGKKAGYAMAFFAAVVPAFVYRTMAGFFEDDSFGFIWMVAGLVFFIKAIKNPGFTRDKILYAAAAGVLFGIMAFAWGLFILVPLILFAYLPFGVLNVYASQGTQKAVDFVKLVLITLGIFSAVSFLADGGNWVHIAINYVLGIVPTNTPLLVVAIAAVFIAMGAYLVFLHASKKGPEKSKQMLSLYGMLALYAVILLIGTIFIFVNDYREGGVLENSVGEENTGKESFRSKYNALIVFPVLALLLIPFLVYKKPQEHYAVLLFIWIAITLFMAWYKLKFTYAFGLPVAVGAGIITAEFFRFFSRHRDWGTKIAAVSLAFMFLLGVAAGTKFVTTNTPNIESDFGWKEALTWIRLNTPEDARFFNWWDQGHWLTFVAERHALLDNRNADYAGDQNFSRFAISLSLRESYDIVKAYDADYLLISHDMPGTTVSYATYAYDTRDLEHPEIKKFFAGPTVSFTCQAQQENGKIGYQCGGNHLTQEEMRDLPSTWQEQPNQIQDNRIPLFVYRDADNSVLQGINYVINQTSLVKIYFNAPEAQKYFEEVYAAKGVKVFKVKKQVS